LIEKIVADPAAPLTPESIAVEVLRRHRDYQGEDESAMAFIKRVRRLLEQHGLSAAGGAVRRGETGDKLRADRTAPSDVEMALFSLDACPTVTDARADEVADEFCRNTGVPERRRR
jgi:hypothetical protein